jgi:hypothetical protein
MVILGRTVLNSGPLSPRQKRRSSGIRAIAHPLSYVAGIRWLEVPLESSFVGSRMLCRRFPPSANYRSVDGCGGRTPLAGNIQQPEEHAYL